MMNAKTQSARVVVVEDEPDIAEFLRGALTKDGFRATAETTAQGALAAIRRDNVDLVILDLMLPDMSGLELLKMLKRDEATAGARVIVVSARTEEVDRVLAFEFGADDYVTKPFSPRELMLRVKAVLQRSAEAGPRPEELITAGPIEIDMQMHEARVEGRPIKLTLTEFRLLAELVRASGRVRSREALLSEVWGYDSEVMSRTVDTHIRRLRNKLGNAANWLDTVRGIGYRIQPPGPEA
ncbi:MAG TPA: response regulator transcription factor [Candidatus Polarisedimenticolaceae bacterium]|nr:response regulator transcription factor [Candidatus Polarisedimenticolaceae bacterium]